MITKQMIAVFSGLCMIASIQAQTEQSQHSITVAVGGPASEAAVYNLDFPGGSPEELIEQMTKASGTRPNVIIPSFGAEVQLPKFKLQNVNSGQVFSALNLVSDDRGLRWIGEGPQDGAHRVWTLIKATPKPKAETCQVVFIGHLLTAFQLDDINAAIRTAWEMSGKTSGPSLKFHKETKLLIAKGTEDELKLAMEVLKALEQASVDKKMAEAKK
jgi:hypothetical protein